MKPRKKNAKKLEARQQGMAATMKSTKGNPGQYRMPGSMKQKQ